MLLDEILKRSDRLLGIASRNRLWLIECCAHLLFTLITMVLSLGQFVKTLMQGGIMTIIDVCADDPEFRHYTDIKQLPPHRLAEIRRSFEDYKKNEKKVNVEDFLPAEAAIDAIKYSMLVKPLFLLRCSLFSLSSSYADIASLTRPTLSKA